MPFEAPILFLSQVKDILSRNGFLYMVTVMDNNPAEVLQLLAQDGIKGS